MAIVADAVPAGMSPDHAAAAIRIVVGGVGRIVVRAVEVTMMMMEVRPIAEAAMIAAVAKAAAPKCGSGVETTTMKTAAVECRRCAETCPAAVETTATSAAERGCCVEASASATAAAVETTTAMEAPAAAAAKAAASTTTMETTTAAMPAHLHHDRVRG